VVVVLVTLVFTTLIHEPASTVDKIIQLRQAANHRSEARA
jgi:hypothetical protein